jgi:predicted dehydrogenase
MKPQISRRQFLRHTSSAAVGLGVGLGGRAWAEAQGANEKIVLGLIGCGGMGRANLKSFMKLKGVEVGALCDVDSKQMQGAVRDVVGSERAEPKTYSDFRRLLEQKDLDAVIIATPDHWHALPFIAACEVGKDIYCEKPISHSLVEAKAMEAAAKHFKRVVQVGTWQRSVKHFQQAIEFVRSGKLGPISVCRAWFVNPFGGWLKDIGKQNPEPPPANLDWDFWLGPAPKVPYAPNRCHVNWRWFFDYGGGLMTDWGVHMIDIVLLGMKESDPLTVASVGGKFVLDDDRDTPDTMQTIYRFPNWVMNWEVRFANGRGLDGGRGHGAEFIGTQGTLVVDREGYQWFPEKPENEGPPKQEPGENTHWQNFLDCVKSRQKPRSDIESMAKTTMVCHLGNIALQAGRTLFWDPKRQDIANRADARSSVSYERLYRAPWKLKNYGA